MIVQEVFGFVKRDGPGEVVRSEAEEVRRGLGVQGKGAAAPLPLLISVEGRLIFDSQGLILHATLPDERQRQAEWANRRRKLVVTLFSSGRTR